jgi:hypothetical protein
MTKQMTLSDAQTELERQGFSVTRYHAPILQLGDIEEESDATKESGGSIVGVLSQWRWILMNRMDVTVFVTELPVLTMEKLSMDLQELPDRLEAHAVGGCPPAILAGTLVLLVYLTRSTIKPEALTRILVTPKMQWGHITFLAAQDGEGGSHYFEASTPAWGRIFYDELRHLAGRLTGRPLPETAPQGWAYKMMAFLHIYLAIFCVVMLLLDPRSMLIGAGFGIVVTAIQAIIKWCSRCRSARPRELHQPILTHCE